ncbi:MAG: PAS domain S-box protein [Candidatus Thorarchaeota archaeon]
MSELPWTSTIQVNRLFDLLDEGVVVLDNSGIIIHANQAFADHLRYAAGDLIDHHFDDFVIEEKKGALSVHISDDRGQSVSLSIVTRSGEKKQIQVRSLGLMDEQESKGHCLIITEQSPDFKKILSSAFLKMVAVDTNLCITYVNPAFREDPSEMLGTLVTDGVAPQYRDEFREKLTTAITKGTNQEFEFSEKNEDRPATWHVLRIGPIKEGDEITGAVIAGYDVTDRVNALQALRESEAKFRGVFDHANDAIVLADEKGNVLEVNKSLEKQFGITRESVIGIPIWEFQSSILSLEARSPEQVESLKNDLIKFFADGTAPWLERITHGTYTHPTDGLVKTFGQTSFRIPTSKGFMFCSFLWDTTEQMKQDEERRTSETRYRALFEEGNDGVLLFDLEGKVLQVNTKGSELLGYDDPQDLVGMPFSVTVPETELAESISRFEALMDGISLPIFERMMLRRDGEEIAVEQNVSLVKDDEANPIHIQNVFRNITERKRTQAALDETRERYELALRGADLGVWDWNAEKDVMIFSDRWAEILGYKVDEIEPSYAGWEKLVHPEDIELMETRWNAHVDGISDFYSSEHRMMTKTGEWKWVLERGKVVELNDEGGTKRATGTLLDITDRIEAEHLLREQESRYRTIVEQSLMGIVILPEGPMDIVFANKKFAEILGYSSGELLDMDSETISEIIHQEDRDKLLNYLRECLRKSLTGSPIQVRMRHKDGSQIWTEVSAGGIEYSGMRAVQVSILDITKRYEAEMALRRERNLFRRLTECAIQVKDTSELSRELLNTIIKSLDFDFGTFRIYNEKKNVLQYSALLGTQIEDTIDELPVDEEFAKQYIIVYSALSKSAMYISDLGKESLDASYLGRLRDLNATSVLVIPILDDDTNLLGVLSLANRTQRIFSDADKKFFPAIANILGAVLERKKAEEALLISERRYRELLTHMSEGIGIVGLDECILFVNNSFAELLGYSSEELIGTSILDLIHPEDVEKVLSQTEIRRQGETSTYTHRFIRKNSEVRTVRVSAVPSRDDSGQVSGTVAIITDITERLKAELEIQRLNEGLARKIEERTAELAAANKELEAFSYSVSHDLRAPLRTIDGFSQALLEDYSESLDDTGQDFLRRVRAAAKQMGSLIEDLLVLSRVTRAEMDRTYVDLSEIAKSHIEELRNIDPEREVDIEIDDSLSVRCDRRLIKLVIQNLLDNAWKFTNRTPNAKIVFGSIEEDGESHFYIKDNGAGFDMSYSDKLFVPFQRLHSVDDFEGSGIGLATVQRVINRHGGKVWAESVVDKGSTFYFTIPE